MDNSQEALNDTATEAPVEAPTTETEAPKAEVEERAEVATEAPTETETTEGSSNKTANARIRELNAKAKAEADRAKAAEEKAQSLAEKLAELTGSFDSSSQEQSYIPQVQPGTEISPEQYQADVARVADARIELKMKQKEVLDNVNNESREVIKTYAQLDPASDKFDADLSESISTATLALISKNPTASVKKFVDSLMKPYLRSVEKSVGDVKGEMAKQVTQTALRPTTVKEEAKTAKEMTLKELEDKLGVVN